MPWADKKCVIEIGNIKINSIVKKVAFRAVLVDIIIIKKDYLPQKDGMECHLWDYVELYGK